MVKAIAYDNIDSISKALELVKALRESDFVLGDWPFHRFPFGLWFRGQSQRKLPLEPCVFRKKQADQSDRNANHFRHHDETNLYAHLKVRTPHYQQTYHTAFEWLCLMQHYSLPTRLLDWSESILPALYFAVNEVPQKAGEIFVLNARRLNALIKKRPTICSSSNPEVIVRSEMAGLRSSKELSSRASVIKATRTLGIKLDKEGNWLKSFTKPIAVLPARLNDRMIFQSSVFTLHGGKMYIHGMKNHYKGDIIPNPVSLEDMDKSLPEEKKFLKRYVIPRECKRGILEDLFVLGIHEGTLFSEVDRQARYLRKIW